MFYINYLDYVAERQGFEPWVPLPARRISSAVLSTTQPSLRDETSTLVGGRELR
jgi:hypothetical protein